MPSLTFSAYFDRFVELYRAGRARALRDDEPAPFNANRLGVLRTHWFDTADYIVATCHLDCPAGDVPTTPYLPLIESWAKRAAEAKGASKKLVSNAASGARFVVSTVASHTNGVSRVHGTQQARATLPSAWHAAFDLATERRRNSHVRTLARVAALNGVHDPCELPSDLATLKRWAHAEGLTDSTADGWQATINWLARRLPGLPTVLNTDAPEERSAKAIPGLAAKLEALGETRPLRELSQREVIGTLHPLLGNALDTMLAHRSGRVVSMSNRKIVGAMSRLVYSLDRDGFPRDGEMPDVWGGAVQVTSDVGAGRAVSGSRFSAEGVRAGSYMRSFLLWNAAASAKNSHLHVAGRAGAAVPFFTPASRQDFDALWDTTLIAYGQTLGTSPKPEDRALWHDVVTEQRTLGLLIEEHNKGLNVLGRADVFSMLELITLPQMLLMGVGELHRRALGARERWEAAGKPRTGDGWLSYRDLCWSWALAMIVLSDGLRIKNYTGALVGRHVIPEWRGGRVVGIGTQFWGISDEERCTLKKHWEDQNKTRENKRSNALYPAFVDPLLATDFFTVIREDRLQRAGILGAGETLTPETDRFALFPSTSKEKDKQDAVASVNPNTNLPWSPQQVPGMRTGRYAKPERLALPIGKLLHWMIRDVMRRPNVPEWDSPEAAALFRGVLVHRPTRAGNASFWGFECDDWKYAKFITNDELATLQKHYARDLNPSGVARLESRTGLDRKGHFANLMHHIREGGAVDWDRFDPARPDRCIRLSKGRAA